MKIGVIGARGLLGRAIYEAVKKPHYTVGITKENYNFHKGTEFDVLINADGNSKKHWANENPTEDFDASVLSVIGSLFDFGFRRYIYLSSIDAEEPRGHYGLHKRLAEDLVMHYCKDYTVLRLPAIVSRKMKRGQIYNIKHNQPCFLTANSTLQIISDTDVAKKMLEIIEGGWDSLTRLYSPNPVSIKRIAEILGKKLIVAEDANEEHYNFTANWLAYGLKKGERYLMEIL